MERLRTEGEQILFRELLRLIERPDPEMTPVLNAWQRLHDRETKQYTTLLLAECGRLSATSIHDLLALLETSEDLVRYRAAIVLYGQKERREPLVSVRQLGMETIETIAEKVIELKHDRRSSVNQALGWFFETLVHNDGDGIHQWADRLASTAGGKA